MTDKDRDDMMLDALFAEARADTAAEPSPDFLAKVLGDAEAFQPTAPEVAPLPERSGFWRSVLAVLGGWPSVSGLAMAATAGVWIGVVGSTSLIEDGIGASLLSAGQDSFLSDLDTSYAFVVE
ncbi:hypothetical protein [Shimia abyssi]|uniref:Dihydroorotate dehydrogenase n=1 Tax=Shimia abyssi TaxID=1662395 RepID=A0A2P8FD68_9RHOB|nr:hypothetical protein [Shimia abyssi]PSL19657.1 hypothetical protein CLV88_10579 [Shimia abyssi]